MKLVAAAALGLGSSASASLLSPFTKLFQSRASPNNADYVLDESDLSALLDEPPSFVSTAETSGLTDIVSLGSVTRMDYLTAQIETWASHRSVRHYWGFSELQDFDPECSTMSDEDRSAAIDACKANPAFRDPKIKTFFADYYGMSEGNRVRSEDAGWLCAQRRVGRALGWLHAQYAGGKTDAPNYLMVVDDDTYVDLVDVMAYLEEETTRSEGAGAFVRAGCVFRETDVIPFPIAYGGFGTVLNKAAVQQLTEPLYCSSGAELQAACTQIEADRVGEASIFQDGMTVLELFYKYSARKNFCMHSDWLLGYIFEFYLSQPASKEGDHNLMGMKTYPSCGNVTVSTGDVRPCTQFSDTCHNQNPKDMEALAISSFAQSPESYKTVPKMELTEFDAAMNIAKDKVVGNAEGAHLPNVLLIDDTLSNIAEFLTSNGVCGPSNQDVHFFDHEDLYTRGVGFYAKSFEHCSENDMIMDTTPETLTQADRVYELYGQVDLNLRTNLKLIVVLRESRPGEFGRYLDTWANLFDREQMLILSFSELQDSPKKTQWRIEQFLGTSFDGELTIDASAVLPKYSVQALNEMHEEFYNFIDASQGPWMEQHPFPRSDVPKKVAYASVLGWNPDESQNKLYLDAMRLMIRSLKNASADFVVLMMYKDKNAEALLASEGAIVQHIAPMKHSLTISYFEPWFVDIALAKLRAFELTGYERVQVLDVDASVTSVKRMDKLFDSFPNVKLVAEGLGSDSPLRAGWLMIKPSAEDFKKMQEILQRGVFTSEHGWDNLDLVVSYPGWKSAESLNNWEFYGSQLEQGLLFHQFYALPKSTNTSAQDSELLTLLDDDTLQSLGFVHFYGERKPWAKNTDTLSLSSHVAVARIQWLKEFEDLGSVSNANHLSPLTPLGVKQYRRAQVLYTYAPTGSPTAKPTASPTAKPTASPTAKPTASPTGSPTAKPTASPTAKPTASGITLQPTASPTAKPTASPTTKPTASPTASRITLQPTASPTAKPTASPTAKPTASPTAKPTASPTAKPTASPTAKPTASPTAKPTASPTAKPTANTTASPTAKPTSNPTASPTAKPTASPTRKPTASPTRKPTASPTRKPTASPTRKPTGAPVSSATTVTMYSSVKWDLNCSSAIANNQLLNIARTIELSLYQSLNPGLTLQQVTLNYVYVYILCNRNVSPHTGVGNVRRLQTLNTSEVAFYTTTTKNCTNCAASILNDTNAVLRTIVDDGSLTTSIQTNSGGNITATVTPNSTDSDLIPDTLRPSSAPTQATCNVKNTACKGENDFLTCDCAGLQCFSTSPTNSPTGFWCQAEGDVPVPITNKPTFKPVMGKSTKTTKSAKKI